MNNKITQRQYTSIILCAFIGVGILALPSDVCKISRQSGWISVLLGGLSPLIILLIASFVDNKMNHSEFWKLNQKIYGKYLCYISPLIFIINSLLVEISVIAGYTNILQFSTSDYLPKFLIVVLVVTLTVFTTYKGLTVLARLCEISLFFIIPLILVPVILFKKGSITNIQPYIYSYESILSAIPKSTFAYQGAELSFLITYFITNRKSTKKSGIIAASIITFLYTTAVFVTIFYLGWELTSKTKFTFLFLFEIIHIPILSDFKAIFVLIWSNVILITLSIFQFSLFYPISKMFNIDYKKICIICLPIILVLGYISVIYDQFRTSFIDKLTPIFSVTINIWVLVTFILVLIKSKGEKNEEKQKN